MGNFRYGSGSQKNMKGVHPKLVMLAEETLKLSPHDITVLSSGGLRTASMQNSLYKKGASKLDGRNQKSMHQKQADGYGHAIDLIPYVSGGPRWEWPLIYPIAGIMAMLATQHGITLRWGGVWDKMMSEYVGTSDDPEVLGRKMQAEVRAYSVRHPGPDFIDGPHYELR